jgi:gliding motility-associated lipoprotein GldH
MRKLIVLLMGATLICCDHSRVYEKNIDFNERQWVVNNQPMFNVEIKDPSKKYNIYCNVRNSVTYPYSRIFINYTVQDTLAKPLQKKLISYYLFDTKSGEPKGNSGLGDVYDHQFLLLKQFQFEKPGTYQIKYEQFMRLDTLPGILSVGLRVEHAE